ncbi:ATP-dependent DNA helicase RecG [Wenzhouxiangella sediminis]|uniref:ATP-dependent DNA helicase RecG n=1 Tax=Wenzhouxiangella sediminis TaxID=1792836 RepID=A0A3E1K944_9GAMM|nr:ATP-dependent DNA helicase RecG [Wenzhouxiangella sediminis]RFF30625.1 ATP-dependent DNA helicase RecG [Wenzhouxiangella sediminis]
MTDRGQAPVAELHGVGPQVASRLKALGITCELDLLFHRPLRYEDRTRIVPLGRVRPETRVQVEGRVVHQEVVQRRRRMLLVTLADDTGQLTLRFFRFFPSQLRMYREGNRVRCFGDVRFGPQGFEMAHPQAQVLGKGEPPPLPKHLTAIYPVTQGLAQATLAKIIDAAVDRLLDGEIRLADPLGSSESPPLQEALRIIHRPGPEENLDALIDGHHPAVQRLATEELLAHHLALTRLNQARARQRAYALKPDEALQEKLLGVVGFEPTGAQRRVVGEIMEDLGAERPMRRLLQGDVGSGKTLVAAFALLAAAASGRQAAIVAPTEILAEQHYRTLSQWLEPLGIEPVWLAGKVKGKARREALARLAGEASIAIGTHALFQEGVEFRDLALIVVDEQHRFGVHQRLALAAKGSEGVRSPHQLVMTATPIPRTLAMTAYAGLDISVIDELPPGRKPVTTVVLSQGRREEIVERLRRALGEGRQAYWVCPLIEESDVLEAQAAETTAEELSAALPEFSVGLIHGRMKPADKQAVMDAFASGKTALLVATTVIEVGVDVPNASLMMIENAERLGLSQLHQLRGRVGRGSEQAACVLIYKPPLGETARKRLETMRETTDGFVIAERDLELRGPGEVLGTRQTGMLRFRVADLARDADLLEPVKSLAESLDVAGADVVIERWLGGAEQFVDV